MGAIAADLDDLCGAWDLASWRRFTRDGGEDFPFTPKAVGRLLYERSGRMAVFLMNPDWARSGSAEGFTAYSGRFRLGEDEVHHIIDFASQKALIGSTQVRHVTLLDDILRLEAELDDQSKVRHVLEWRRAG